MLKQFFRDGLVYGISGVFSRGIQILLIPVYTRIFAPEEYGVIDWIYVLAAIINLTVALEISQGVARYFSDEKDAESRKVYASTALGFTMFSYGVFAVVCVMFSTSLSRLLFGTEQWSQVLAISVIAVAINGIYILMQDMLRWNFKPVAYAMASITYAIIAASVSIYLVLVPKLGIAGVFYGQATGAVVGALISLFMSKDIYRPLFDIQRCWKMLKYSMPLVLSSIAIFLSLYIDRISIKYIIGLEQLGVYGVGFRFASIMSLLLLGFQASVTPLIFRNHDKTETPGYVSKMFNIYLLFTGALVILLAMFSMEILQLFTTPAYYAAWSVIPVLALSIAVANSYIFAPGLNLAKKTVLIAGVNIFAAMVNFGLNMLLIPTMGINGAALASLASAALAFILFIYNSQKNYPVPYTKGRVSFLYVILVAGVVMGYMLHSGALIFSENLLVKIMLTLLLPISFIFILLSRQELRIAWTYVFGKKQSSV